MGERFGLRRILLFYILLAFLLASSPQNRLSGYIYYRRQIPTTLDPALIVDVTGGSLPAKLFNGLVRMNKNLDIIPDIASKWKISENGLVYGFELKKGVKISNSREATAGDFKYPLEIRGHKYFKISPRSSLSKRGNSSLFQREVRRVFYI